MVGGVPFTLQVLFVLLAGMVLGARWGLASVAAYLVLGLIAPVYAQGSGGLAILLGPTGGYLWGFLGAVALIGMLARRTSGSRFVTTLPVAAAGLIPIYVLGAAWLSWHLDIGIGEAVAVGVVPFLAFDLAKAAIVAAVAVALFRSPLALLAPAKSR